jgi:hypothetical protein
MCYMPTVSSIYGYCFLKLFLSRDSKLTQLLQNSLSGQTNISIIVAVSPAEYNVRETLSTLDFARTNIANRTEAN